VHKSPGLHRFLTFVDAIIAIAITLLVLPLVEMTSELTDETPLEELWRPETIGKYGSFVLSFAVIFRLWQVHHKLMEPIESYDRVVAVVTAAWALTIVFMPFPTALIGIYGNEEVPVIALYLLTLFVSSALLTVLALYLARKTELHQADVESSKRMAVPSVVTTILTGLAAVIGILVPRVNYGGLLLLLLTGVVTVLVNRRLRLPQKEA